MRPARDSWAAMLPAIDRVGTGRAVFDATWLLTVYAVLLMLIPATLIFAPLGGTGTPATAFACCILLWYLFSWTAERLTPSGGGRLIRVATLIFALAVLASFVAAMTRDITEPEVLAADSGLVWLVASVALVIVACEAITDYGRLDTLLRRLVILGSVISAVGILQSLGLDLTQYVHIPGLSVNTVAVQTGLTRNGFVRPQGTASQPIEFGVVLAMLLPLALQQAFDPARGGKFRRWAPVALIGFTAPLTVSRSGIIGLGVAFLFLFPSWKLRRQGNALCVLVICVGAMHVLVHGLIGTFIQLFKGIFNGQDSSVNDRLADYSGVAQYIQQRPIFGRGFGTFLPLVYRYTDNMYLLATVEIGVVGVLAMSFLFIAGMQSAALGRRRTQEPRRREIGQALFASMAVAAAASATFDSLTFPMFSGMFFLLLGCCGAYYSIMTADAPGAALAPVHRPADPDGRARGHPGGRARGHPEPVPGR
jgi:polysaccharide biosynthesis protein PslJ